MKKVWLWTYFCFAFGTKAVNGGDLLPRYHDRDLQPDCNNFLASSSTAGTATVNWIGSGADGEWMDAANWNKPYLPGVSKPDRAVLATSSDIVTVTCPATYMDGALRLAMRSSAELRVYAALTIPDWATVDTSALIQIGTGGSLTIGTSMTMNANLALKDAGSLAVQGLWNSNAYAFVSLEGDSYQATMGSDFNWYGTLDYKAGPQGFGSIVIDGALMIDTASSTLQIDLAGYTFSSCTLKLIQYSSTSSTVGDISQVTVSNLNPDQIYDIQVNANFIELVLTGNCGSGGPPTFSPDLPTAPPTYPLPTDIPTAPPTIPLPTDIPTAPPTYPLPTTPPSVPPTLSPMTPPSALPTAPPTHPLPTDIPTAPPTPPTMTPPTPDPISPQTTPPIPDPSSPPGACPDLPPPSQLRTGTTIHWDNTGPDSDWWNPMNWPSDYIPGTGSTADRVILATLDTVEISCPVLLLPQPVRLELRSTASLTIAADFDIGSYLRIDSPASLTQNQGTTVTVGDYLELYSTYTMTNFAQLEIGSYMTWSGRIIMPLDLTSPSSSAPIMIDGILTSSPDGILEVHVMGYTASTANVQVPMIALMDPTITDTSGSNPPALVVTGLPEGVMGRLEAVGTSYVFTTEVCEQVLPSTIAFTATSVTAVATCTDITTGSLVIDGTNFQGTQPGIYPLITNVDGTGPPTGQFDPINVKLVGFQNKHFWFELLYRETDVALQLKSISDFSGYENRGDGYNQIGGYAEQTTKQELHPPPHDWNSVPGFLTTRKNNIDTNPYTVDQLEKISQYPVLKLDELQGATGVIETNDAMGRPPAVILSYVNSKVYWPASLNDLTGFQFPAWVKCTETSYKPAPSGICKYHPTHPSYLYTDTSGRHIFNHTIDEFRQWWVEKVVEQALDDNWSGVFVDAIEDGIIGLSDQYQTQMIEELHAVFPSHKLCVGNALRQIRVNGNRHSMAFLDGSYMENWNIGLGLPRQDLHQLISASIQLAREALSNGKLILWNASPWLSPYPDPNHILPWGSMCFPWGDCQSYGISTQNDFNNAVDFPLAAFLMLAEDNAFLNYKMQPLVRNVDKSYLWNQLEVPKMAYALGQPLGPPLVIGKVFRRSFENLEIQLDMAEPYPARVTWIET